MRLFASCSEGERARILLARGLISGAPLLALDEPAAGLDLGGRELLLERLRPGVAASARPHDAHRHAPHRGAAAYDEPRAAPARRTHRRRRPARRGADRREPQRLLRAAAAPRAPRRAGVRAHRELDGQLHDRGERRRRRSPRATPPAGGAARRARPPRRRRRAHRDHTRRPPSRRRRRTRRRSRRRGSSASASTFLSAFTRWSESASARPRTASSRMPCAAPK